MVPERELRKPPLMVSPSVSTQLVPPAPPASLPTRLPPQALSNRTNADATQIPLRRRRLNAEGVVLISRPLTGQCTWETPAKGNGGAGQRMPDAIEPMFRRTQIPVATALRPDRLRNARMNNADDTAF